MCKQSSESILQIYASFFHRNVQFSESFYLKEEILPRLRCQLTRHYAIPLLSQPPTKKGVKLRIRQNQSRRTFDG